MKIWHKLFQIFDCCNRCFLLWFLVGLLVKEMKCVSSLLCFHSEHSLAIFSLSFLSDKMKSNTFQKSPVLPVLRQAQSHFCPHCQSLLSCNTCVSYPGWFKYYVSFVFGCSLEFSIVQPKWVGKWCSRFFFSLSLSALAFVVLVFFTGWDVASCVVFSWIYNSFENLWLSSFFAGQGIFCHTSFSFSFERFGWSTLPPPVSMVLVFVAADEVFRFVQKEMLPCEPN